MLDPQSQLILLVIFAVVGVIIAFADGAIFVRWLVYLWAKHDVEERRARAAADAEAAPLYPAEPPPATAAAEYTELRLSSAPPEHPQSEPAPIRPDLEMPEYPFARTWSLVDPFITIQIVLGVSSLVIGVALLALLISTGQVSNPEAMFGGPSMVIQSVGGFFMNALFVGMTAFYVHRYRSSLTQIGLGRPTLRQVGIGLGLGVALFAIATGAENVVGFVLPHLLPKAVVDGLVKLTGGITAGGIFAKIPSMQVKIVFALSGIVAAPIGEEIYFRGLLYNSLKRRFNVPAAIVISGFLFALLHIGPLAIIVIFPMGMLLAYVYERTRSLWVTISIHVTNNALGFAMLMMYPQTGEPKEPFRPVSPPARPAHERVLPPAAPPLTGRHRHG